MDSMSWLVEKLNPSVRRGWPRDLHKYEQYKVQLKSKLLNLLTKQEAFNLIIMGPPGCGKNTFFETCDGELKTEYEDDYWKKRKVIYLNGLSCGRDLKASINEIFNQLRVSDADAKGMRLFDERLDSILELLRSKLNESGASKKSRVLIFVLDKLEYFCESVQLLLYNLLDTCSSEKGCLGVVGLTSRVDITEMFEKRVKSRFSHRIINLVGGRNFQDYLVMATSLMQSQQEIEWNKEMSIIMQSVQTKKYLKMLFDTDKSIGRLEVFLYEVALMSSNLSDIPSSIVKVWDSFNASSKVQQCLDLTVYDIFLVVAIKKIYPEPFHYEMLWHEISPIAFKYKLSRHDLLPSFNTLEETELIVPIRVGGSIKNNDKKMYKSALTINDIITALKNYPNLPSDCTSLQ